MVGHARAIELVYGLLDAWPGRPVDKQQLFDLHRAVQTGIVTDIDKPVGGWKLETLAAYQLGVGPLTPATGVWPRPDLEAPFLALCRDAYAATHALVAAAEAQQAGRAGSRGQGPADLTPG